mmetsp:Transcript_109617/g.353857  ORF Transcript_109617/g.353857 Transcript_109617/m.353857 type:complete len:225 (+) Transcript_109617:152-826(+)
MHTQMEFPIELMLANLKAESRLIVASHRRDAHLHLFAKPKANLVTWCSSGSSRAHPAGKGAVLGAAAVACASAGQRVTATARPGLQAGPAWASWERCAPQAADRCGLLAASRVSHELQTPPAPVASWAAAALQPLAGSPLRARSCGWAPGVKVHAVPEHRKRCADATARPEHCVAPYQDAVAAAAAVAASHLDASGVGSAGRAAAKPGPGLHCRCVGFGHCHRG